MNAKKILTRVIAMLLVTVIMLTSFASCSYSPIEPTEEESKVVMKIHDLEVTYDFFRYLFLTYKNDIDGGDNSVWSSPEADEYWQKAVDKIVPLICERYAVLDLAKANGVDIYGEGIDAAVQKYIDVAIDGNEESVYANVAIDGGEADGLQRYYRLKISDKDSPYEPYGSKRKYIKALAEMYMTDNVSRLLFRQEVCDALMYYILTDEDIGTIPTDDETALKYLNGPNYINTLWIVVRKNGDGLDYETNKKKAEDLYNKVKDLPENSSGDEAFRQTIVNNTVFTADDIYMYPGEYLDVVDDKAFQLAVGQTTELIEDSTGFYIIRRIPNDMEYISENLEALRNIYLSVAYYTEVDKVRDILLEDVEFTDFFATLDGTKIFWPEE